MWNNFYTPNPFVFGGSETMLPPVDVNKPVPDWIKKITQGAIDYAEANDIPIDQEAQDLKDEVITHEEYRDLMIERTEDARQEQVVEPFRVDTEGELERLGIVIDQVEKDQVEKDKNIIDGLKIDNSEKIAIGILIFGIGYLIYLNFLKAKK